MSIKSVTNDTASSDSIINAQKPLPPTINNYSVGGVDDTALDPAGGQTVLVNGTGFLRGATITFDGNAVSVVTFVNATQLSFTSPAKSAGTYTIYVVNPDGGTAIYLPGIIYSLLPTWTTSAGSLGSYYETTNISNTVVASGDAPITYSLYSGSLPSGSTLYANGTISGTAPVDSGSTTYSFTIQATDAQLQDSTRSFSLTINTDVVTWVSPANGTTYTNSVNTAISNVVLSATDAAGYNVTYSANALPTGLSLSGANISGTPTVIANSSTLLTATAATTNRSATRTINWSITVAGDPYFKYVTLLLNGDNTTAPFASDASINNSLVTVNGSTSPNSFNPYQNGYYSNYFNGSSNLAVPAGPAFNLTTVDFCIEMWVYPISQSSYGSLLTFDTSDYPLSFSWAGVASPNIVFCAGTSSAWFIDGASFGTTVLNQWTHLVVTRSGNVFRTFQDGVLRSYNTNAGSIGDSSGSIYIGSNGSTGYNSAANISNLRIVKGSIPAEYQTSSTTTGTTIFTPPTTAVTAISGTSLLTCQSRQFIDAGPNNFTITTSGSPTISYSQPFGTPTTANVPSYYSNKFNGSTDYISVPDSTVFTMGAGDFTLECWVNLSSISQVVFIGTCDSAGNQGSMSFTLGTNSSGVPRIGVGNGGTVYYATAASAITTGQWYHIAGVRNGASVYVYVNGVQSTALNMATLPITDSSQVVAVGRNGAGNFEYVNGLISNARIVKGVAVYTGAFTPPTSPLQATQSSGTNISAITGTQTSLLTCQNSTFIDNSTNAFTVTSAGSVVPVTGTPFTQSYTQQTVTNYGSGYFPNTGYVNGSSLGGVTSPALGTQDHTIEFWMYMVATPQTYANPWSYYGAAAQQATNNYYFNVGGGGGVSIGLGGGGSWVLNLSATLPSLNVWHHYALTRSGTTYRLFIDGLQVATQTSVTANITAPAGPMAIGSYSATADNGNWVQGYMADFRYVVGTAVYTSNFVLPTSPLTAVTNTSLLTLQTNGGSNNNGFIDNSPNNFLITRYGNTTQGSVDPFGANWSNYFPANGNYLTGSNSIFNISATTVVWNFECWVYPISSGVFFAIGSGSTYGNSFYFEWGLGTANKFRFLQGTGGSNPVAITTSGTYTGNTWYHVAVSRTSAGVIKLFVNGTLDGTQTYNAGTLANGTTFVVNGSYDNNGLGSGGGNFYISNLRFLVGTALYTANFTPPTTPLTPITNTALLTCQSSSFQDNSPNNLAITLGSTPSVQRLSPFSNVSQTPQSYSTYIPSAITNYVSVPHNANLTITSGSTDSFIAECWVYFNTVTASTTIMNQSGVNPSTFWNWRLAVDANKKFEISWGQTGSPGSLLGTLYGTTVAAAGVWYHLALVKTNADWSLFVNGTREATYNGLNSASDGTNNPLRIGSDTFSSQSITGYISNVRIYKGATANAPYLATNTTLTVPTSPLTAITNTQLLTCQNATLIDNSTNAFTLTAAGSPTPNQLNPFGYTTSQTQSYSPTVYGGSMYFDGSGDYLTTASASTSFNLGAGDFTIDCWVYPTTGSLTYGKFIFGNSQDGGANGWGLNIQRDSGPHGIFLVLNNSIVISSGSTTVTVNAWNHIAVVRSGSGSNNLKIYLNGVSVAQATVTTTDTNNTAMSIGGDDSTGSLILTGYLSNTRFVKGTAVYTSNFVPPAAPATAITNTSLLVNGTAAGIYDYSMMNDLETVGNAQLAPQQPYAGTYYSNYFNGSTDYFATPSSDTFTFGTGDFTVEAWVNIPALPSGYSVLGGTFYTGSSDAYWFFAINSSGYPLFTGRFTNLVTGTSAVTANTWTHIAISRQSGTNRVFVNGVLSGTSSTSINFSGVNTMTVGQAGNAGNFTGYISNFRIVKGTAVYTSSFTPSTNPLTAISGTSLLTCQSNKFIDNSTNNFTLTATGTPTVQVFNPFANTNTGGQSMYFDGTGDYLTAPSNPAFTFGTGDFTIEGWIYPTTVSASQQGILDFRSSNNGKLCILLLTSTIYFQLTSGNITTPSGSITANAWSYITVVKYGTTVTVYVNGVSKGSATDTGSYATADRLTIGNTQDGNYFNGYIDDLRITKGYARYTTNFTPPTTPFLTK